MPAFKIKAIVKGIPTEVVVKEPAAWNKHEFSIAFLNKYVKDDFTIGLKDGRWEFIRKRYHGNRKGQMLEVSKFRELDNSCTLEPLEIEAIGLEIAKLWVKRLSDSLLVFQELF